MLFTLLGLGTGKEKIRRTFLKKMKRQIKCTINIATKTNHQGLMLSLILIVSSMCCWKQITQNEYVDSSADIEMEYVKMTE